MGSESERIGLERSKASSRPGDSRAWAARGPQGAVADPHRLGFEVLQGLLEASGPQGLEALREANPRSRIRTREVRPPLKAHLSHTTITLHIVRGSRRPP